MDKQAGSNTKKKRKQQEELGPILSAAAVKAIMRQDDSIGRITVEANVLLARCLDAFLAHLVRASAEVTMSAPRVEYVNGAIQAARGVRQLAPKDVQDAVEDEERFDFLRPVFETLQERQAIQREEAKRRPRRGRKPQNDNKSSKTKNKPKMGSTSADTEATSSSDSLAAGVTMVRTSGGVLVQAGLDSEESRRALLMMQEAVTGGSSAGGGGVKDEGLDDDYDDC